MYSFKVGEEKSTNNMIILFPLQMYFSLRLVDFNFLLRKQKLRKMSLADGIHLINAKRRWAKKDKFLNCQPI